MSFTNRLRSALIAANPIWTEVSKPYRVDGGTAYSFGDTLLGAFFLTEGLAFSYLGETIVGVFGPGDLIGYHALLHDVPSPIRIVAETSNRGFKLIPASCRQIVRGCENSRKILDKYAHRMAVEATIDVAVAAEKIDRRIAHRLLDLSDRLGSSDIPLSHARLAHLIGKARRTTVTEALAVMVAEGAIEQVDRGKMRLLATEVLEKTAGETIKHLRVQREMHRIYLEGARRALAG